MAKTYLTAIPQFLDDTGEIADMPAAARRMASFQVSIIDAITRVYPTVGHDTSICCRKRGCKGSIHASLHTLDGKITWWCPICTQNGVISHWQGTKWDHTGKASTPSVSVESKPTAKYTPKEGKYLAFIYYYTKLNRQAPAERDIQQYFQVTPPAVHDMIVKLEKRGFISREPGKPRSIRLLVKREELPDLE
ncbi:MAG: LexA family protein [Thermoguttaceae bacterium]